jgi:hypothetical protein
MSVTFVDVADLYRFDTDIELEDSTGQWFNSGLFITLLLDVVAKDRRSPETQRLLNALNALSTRWNSALTASAEIDWLQAVRDDEHFSPLVRVEFLANDIVGFLGDVRAGFDCIRDVFKGVCPEIKGGSFSGLRKQVLDDPLSAEDKFGEEIAILIGRCDWFEPLRDLRDALIHQRSKLIVIPDVERTEFNLLDNQNELISDQALMSHDGSVDFRFFAAAVLSRLYCLMEDTAEIVTKRRHVPAPDAYGQSIFFPYGTVREWMLELLDHLEEPRKQSRSLSSPRRK